MNNILEFFSDPKLFISILAVFISLFSLGWSIKNQVKQNRQWVVLNQANVQLKKTKLFLFKECTFEEINRKNYWGYKFTAYPDETFSKFQMPSYLIAKYTTTNKTVENLNMVFTISEADNMLRDLGIKEEWSLYKQFKVGFQFDNVGKTDAKNVSTKILLEDPVTKQWQTGFSSEKDTLAAGMTIVALIGYSIPVSIEEPKKINYLIEIKYKDIYEKSHHKKIRMMWNIGNTWSYVADTN